MFFTLGKLIAKAYSLLLAAAIGGLVGANLFGFVVSIFIAIQWVSDHQEAASTDSLLWWMHCGWVAGAGLALVGTITQTKRSRRRTADKDSDHDFENVKPAPTKKTKRWRTKPSGIFSAIGLFSFFGGFLGLMLGGSLVLFWFSLAYSPFSPADWASSITVEQRQAPNSGLTESAMTTRHPMVFYIFGTPIVVGVTTGALIGGVGVALGKIENRE